MKIMILPLIACCLTLLACEKNEAPQQEKETNLTYTYPIVDTGVETFYTNLAITSTQSESDAFYGQNANYTGNRPSYTNNQDGTVTDNVTGLMWEQDMGEKLTFEEAFAKADKSYSS